MARFMTREVEGIFKRLEKECGDKTSLSVTVSRWNFSHVDGSNDPELQISIQTEFNDDDVKIFYLDKYESVDEMVDAAISQMREWREEE